MKKITIDPITRLEGHGKISIFLNDEGEVANTYFSIPELRGFEKFLEGRRYEGPKTKMGTMVTTILSIKIATIPLSA